MPWSGLKYHRNSRSFAALSVCSRICYGEPADGFRDSISPNRLSCKRINYKSASLESALDETCPDAQVALAPLIRQEGTLRITPVPLI
jgi:hypothetical protein